MCTLVSFCAFCCLLLSQNAIAEQLGRVLYAAFVDAHPHLASLLVVPSSAPVPVAATSTPSGGSPDVDGDGDDDASVSLTLSPSQRRRRAKKQRQQQQKQQQQTLPLASAAQSVDSSSSASASISHPPLLESILHVVEYYAACIGELAEMARVVISTVPNHDASAALPSLSTAESEYLSESTSAADAHAAVSSDPAMDDSRSILEGSYCTDQAVGAIDDSVSGGASYNNQSISSGAAAATTAHASLFSPLPSLTPFSSPVGVAHAVGRISAEVALNDHVADDSDDDDDVDAVEQSGILCTGSADEDDPALLSSVLDKRSSRHPQQWRPCVFELRKNRILHRAKKAGNVVSSVSGLDETHLIRPKLATHAHALIYVYIDLYTYDFNYVFP